MNALGPISFGADTDFTSGVDDPVPRDRAAIGQSTERIPDLSSSPAEAGKLGDLPIGCHAAPGDFGDDHGDAFVTSRSGHRVGYGHRFREWTQFVYCDEMLAFEERPWLERLGTLWGERI